MLIEQYDLYYYPNYPDAFLTKSNHCTIHFPLPSLAEEKGLLLPTQQILSNIKKVFAVINNQFQGYGSTKVLNQVNKVNKMLFLQNIAWIMKII